MQDGKRKLNERRQKFVDEYLKDGNATRAYLRAGYKSGEEAARRSASDLLTNPVIASAVAEGQRRLREQAGVTQQMVIEGLLQEARDKGEDASHSARVASWSHLARILGMFTEKHEVTNPDGSLRQAPVIIEVVGGTRKDRTR